MDRKTLTDRRRRQWAVRGRGGRHDADSTDIALVTCAFVTSGTSAPPTSTILRETDRGRDPRMCAGRPQLTSSTGPRRA
jgi:hypothetical protein